MPTLSGCASLNDVRELVATAEPDASVNAVGNFAAQLWALAGRMAIGDYVVLPRKEHLAKWRSGGSPASTSTGLKTPDPDKRHVRPVKWLRTDVPRSAIKQDLLYSLGAFSTYCQVSRNEAAARIAAIAANGSDPGSKVAVKPSVNPKPPAHPDSSLDGDSEVPDADESRIDLEEYAESRIEALIHEEFAGHRMAVLVGALLPLRATRAGAPPRAPTAASTCSPDPGRSGWTPPSWSCRSRASRARSATR